MIRILHLPYTANSPNIFEPVEQLGSPHYALFVVLWHQRCRGIIECVPQSGSFIAPRNHVLSIVDGTANLPRAAQTIIDQITLLTKPPTNARHFLVVEDYSRGKPTTAGEAFKQQYFSGLNTLRQTVPGFRVAFVDLKTIWEGVLGSDPGFAAFGYTSSGACTVSDQTTVGACSDAAHTFYWIPG